MSLFRVIKYSSILFFLGKYKSKLFKVIAVLLFAFTTSLLYQDVNAFLEQKYPDTVIYALLAKIIIVYGSLIFVLLQFRPQPEEKKTNALKEELPEEKELSEPAAPINDRLSKLEDIESKDTLGNRYDSILKKLSRSD